VLDVEVIHDPSTASVALEPVRSRLLGELLEPASAAALAARLGIARQKINYHLTALEQHRLVKPAGQRKWGGLTERLLVASAASYVVSPTAMGPVAANPARNADRLSAGYLIALGARIVNEVSRLVTRSADARQHLPSLAVDTEIRFKSPADRAAFSHDLTEAIARLVSQYHDATTPGGRNHRLVLVAHPTPTTEEP
jgi:hypothetical protein